MNRTLSVYSDTVKVASNNLKYFLSSRVNLTGIYLLRSKNQSAGNLALTLLSNKDEPKEIEGKEIGSALSFSLSSPVEEVEVVVEEVVVAAEVVVVEVEVAAHSPSSTCCFFGAPPTYVESLSCMSF